MNASNVKLCLFVTLALTAAPVPQAAPQPFTDAEHNGIAGFVEENFNDSDFGVVIGVIDDDGSTVYSAGHPDAGTDREVNGDTIFEIGSITKTFTSLLLLDMVRRGEMETEDPVSDYLPDGVRMPSYEGQEITLLNLAAQDSGLPFNADNLIGADTLTAYNAYTVEDMYAFLSGYELTVAPGTRFQYSNLGMSLLGHVMEKRSGEDFETLVATRILKPLGMDDTGIVLTPEQRDRMAIGHDGNGNRTGNYDLQAMQAAGALNSTARDMLKYLAAELGFVETDLAPLIEQTQIVRHEDGGNFGNSAMPWVDRGVYQPEESRFYGHAGGTPGYSAFVGFDTDKKRGVVVLTNQRLVESNRRLWMSESLGWTLLQGLPLTPERGSQPVYKLTGLGIGLEPDEGSGFIRINRVFQESAAGRAGVQTGAQIRAVNGVSVENRSIQETLDLMAGPAGTRVRLELADPALQETRTIELTKSEFLTL